ncbi:MAG: metallophosphoesterase [Oscillospiraceae bacterium]|nr:metallophosphoesterase [Oscillospiraceae bacterium]
MQAIITKFISIITSILMLLGIPAGSLGNGDGNAAGDMTVSFADETPGSMAGSVKVKATVDGEYDIYWGDAEGSDLTANVNGKTVGYSEFATVEVRFGSGELEFNDFLAIPEGAETMVLKKGDKVLETETIPENKRLDYGTQKYAFGALSDVHFNRYSALSDDDTVVSFPRALNYLKDWGVSVVGISGDLSLNGELDSYEKYNSVVSQYDFPVYTCKGNHDCRKYYTLSNWQKNVNKDIYGASKPAGILDVSSNGLDFVYECNGDIFIFFSQVSNTYMLGVQLVTDGQLDWLEKQFAAYKDRNVYLFFHTFLGSDGIPTNMCEGNIINPLGATYTLTYVKGNKDEKRFKQLLAEYKNVVFFNGHSHWSYDMQKYNRELNISDYDGKYAPMVHVSSVAAPRTVTDTSLVQKSNPGYMSEGLYMTVYNDMLLIRAVDFISGEFLAYATYIVK